HAPARARDVAPPAGAEPDTRQVAGGRSAAVAGASSGSDAGARRNVCGPGLSGTEAAAGESGDQNQLGDLSVKPMHRRPPAKGGFPDRWCTSLRPIVKNFPKNV